MTFSNPVAVSANTTYVASYFAPAGHYSVTSGGFSTAVDNPPLHALANGTSANGVFTYGAASSFPTASWGAANYSVDVLFAAAGAPGQATGVERDGGAVVGDASTGRPRRPAAR